VECALRLLSEQYSGHLPKDDQELAILARLLGYSDSSEAARAFMEDYKKTTQDVRKFYKANLDILLRTSI
jgi:glutamine synthetase adenylyltransferase